MDGAAPQRAHLGKGAIIGQRTFRTLLEASIPRVSDIVTFRLERPRGYEYQAGQWFAITIPGPEGPYDHHFSHSSSPSEPFLELTTRLRGSAFKDALAALPDGSEVEFEGPYGSFTLQEGLERVGFIAGGIGITCVRSILRWLTDTRELSPNPQRPREMVLFFANRSEDEIPFRDELERMAEVLVGLRVVHVLSHPSEGWPGRRGHVDEEVLTTELYDPQSWAYYLSGPPSFVGAMREMLAGLDVESGSVRMERFDGYE